MDKEIMLFFGKEMEEWEDIYRLLAFKGDVPKSFKDLYVWRSPLSPQGCMNIAFDLSQARVEIPGTPVRDWAFNIMTHKRNQGENQWIIRKSFCLKKDAKERALESFDLMIDNGSTMKAAFLCALANYDLMKWKGFQPAPAESSKNAINELVGVLGVMPRSKDYQDSDDLLRDYMKWEKATDSILKKYKGEIK